MNVTINVTIQWNYDTFGRKMKAVGASDHGPKKDVHSVWALLSEHVSERVKKLMVGMRSEFGGPEFEP
ncbi:hypothetical protein HanPI659440_Chr12g0468541 [Helianthus annuus]|nr:hypothetical protein HanPI659440_Chr12g0468541 [Helianthus annuus]